MPSMNKRFAAPAAYGNTISVNNPHVVPTKSGCRVMHRGKLPNTVLYRDTEANFGADIVTNRVELNPGLNALFPWLNAVAKNYEMYRFVKVRFVYVPSCPTDTAGNIYLIPEYDPQDAGPSTTSQAMTYLGAVTGSVWEEHYVEMDPAMMSSFTALRYCRYGAGYADIRLADSGVFFYATQGGTSGGPIALGNACGTIYMEYVIDFFLPQQLGSTLNAFGGNQPVGQGTEPTVVSVESGRTLTTTADNIFGDGLGEISPVVTDFNAHQLRVVDVAGTSGVFTFTHDTQCDVSACWYIDCSATGVCQVLMIFQIFDGGGWNAVFTHNFDINHAGGALPPCFVKRMVRVPEGGQVRWRCRVTGGGTIQMLKGSWIRFE